MHQYQRCSQEQQWQDQGQGQVHSSQDQEQDRHWQDQDQDHCQQDQDQDQDRQFKPTINVFVSDVERKRNIITWNSKSMHKTFMTENRNKL